MSEMKPGARRFPATKDSWVHEGRVYVLERQPDSSSPVLTIDGAATRPGYDHYSYRVVAARLLDNLDAAQEYEAATLESGHCAWADDENGAYTTSCGQVFELTEDGPKENGMRFCCYCGNPLKEVPYTGGEE